MRNEPILRDEVYCSEGSRSLGLCFLAVATVAAITAAVIAPDALLGNHHASPVTSNSSYPSLNNTLGAAHSSTSASGASQSVNPALYVMIAGAAALAFTATALAVRKIGQQIGQRFGYSETARLEVTNTDATQYGITANMV